MEVCNWVSCHPHIHTTAKIPLLCAPLLCAPRLLCAPLLCAPRLLCAPLLCAPRLLCAPLLCAPRLLRAPRLQQPVGLPRPTILLTNAHVWTSRRRAVTLLYRERKTATKKTRFLGQRGHSLRLYTSLVLLEVVVYSATNETRILLCPRNLGLWDSVAPV
jgi:hypothetical protein